MIYEASVDAFKPHEICGIYCVQSETIF